MSGLNKRWAPVRRYTTLPRQIRVWQWEFPEKEGWMRPQDPWTLWTLFLWITGMRPSPWPPRQIDPEKIRKGTALYPLRTRLMRNVSISEGQPRAEDVPVGGFQLWEATSGVRTILVYRRVA